MTTTSNTGGRGNHNSSQIIPPIQGVTLKMAFDVQGGVADLAQEKSERFTCPESLDMVHRLRRDCDAVLVGRKTVEIDDCTLTIRRVPVQPTRGQPIRVVVDPQKSLDLDNYKIATDGLETLIYYHDSELDGTQISYTSHVDEQYPNVQWIGLPSRIIKEGHSPSLSARDLVLDMKFHHGIDHIMVEGGPATARQFLQEHMVDRAILVYASMAFQIPVLSNLTRNDFEAAGLELLREGSLGVDRVEYWSRPGLSWPNSSNEGDDDSVLSSSSSSFWP